MINIIYINLNLFLFLFLYIILPNISNRIEKSLSQKQMSTKPQSNNNQHKSSNILSEIQIINRKSQDLMLKNLEEIMPQDYNFSQLATIFQKNQLQPLPLYQLNYKILKYFCKTLSENCINMKGYQLLQQQLQKSQATIRSHIKVQQQMKMYLDYLQSKISNYQSMLNKTQEQQENDKAEYLNQLEILKSKQSILMKQKIALLKRNEQLSRQIQKKNQQIKILQQKPKAQNFITQYFPTHNQNQISQLSHNTQNSNQLSNLTQISNPDARKSENAFDGPYSYRKVQNYNYPSFAKEIHNMIPNRSHNQFIIQNINNENDRQKNAQSHLIRKSTNWCQPFESKRKKTEQIAPGSYTNQQHYQSVNSQDDKNTGVVYRTSNTQGDRIIQQSHFIGGYRKLDYQKVNQNLKSSLKRNNFSNHQQFIQKQRSVKSQYSSQKINPNQIGRRIQIKRPQSHNLSNQKSKFEYDKYYTGNNNQSFKDNIKEQKKSNVTFNSQNSNNNQSNSSSKIPKSYHISLIAGGNQNKSNSFNINNKYQIMNHPDNQLTQKKSSNPQQPNFYSQRGQNYNQPIHHNQTNNQNSHHYIRLPTHYKN